MRYPVFETLASFNEVLPAPAPDHEGTDISGFLYVSNLKASTLTHLGEITTRWATCIGSYLDLDFVGRNLSLFSFPAFCQLHASAGSVLS